MMTRLLVTLLVTVCVPASAVAKESAFLYTERKLPSGRVLVPRLVQIREGGTLRRRVRALFDRLRQDFPRAYGAIRLDLSGSAADRLDRERIASVILDPQRRSHHPLVLGELVYTLTAVGVDAVIASVAGETGAARHYRRKDISTPAFVLVLPFWRGLPPTPISGVLVRLPSGDLTTARAIEQRLAAGEERLAGLVLSMVGHARLERRIRAVRALGFLPQATSRPKLLGLLRDPSAKIRGAAVDGLGRAPVAETLRAIGALLTADPDPGVRKAAARALMQSGDQRATLSGIAYVLAHTRSEEKVSLLQRLRSARVEGVARALIPVLADRNEAVRLAALEALEGSADPKLLRAASELVSRDKSARVRAAAARLLERSENNEYVAKGLSFLVSSGSSAGAVGAIERLAGLGPAGRIPLERALASASAPIREAAVRGLARIADERSLPALSQAARAGLASAAAAAKALLTKASPATLAKLLGDGDALLRRLAADAGASVGGPVLREALLGAAGDRVPEVRVAVAGALGRIGGESVGPTLSRLLQDERDDVRSAAAHALGQAAIASARPALLALVKYGNVKVRRAVTEALGRLPGTPSRQEVTRVLDVLYDDDPQVRALALNALARASRKDRRILPTVRLQIKDGDSAVRAAAIRALGQLGDAGVLSTLGEALHDADPGVRLEVVSAIARIGGPTAAKILAAHATKEKDAKVARRARAAAAAAR